jgi:ATP-dependent protease Clp ATPase subunit
MSTIIKEQNNVRRLLFAGFGIPVEKAIAYLDDMEAHPEKASKYNQLLTKLSTEQYESIREKPIEELKRMAKERVKEWTERIGPVSTHEYVTMSKLWDIPIDGIINEKITPELIKKMLDFFVIGQEKYKVKLSVAFFTYLMHGRQANSFLPKSNLLVCGPSGSGKTYGMQTLAKLFHVPFVTIHCNSLVQEGIVGPGLTDGFTSLLTHSYLTNNYSYGNTINLQAFQFPALHQ